MDILAKSRFFSGTSGLVLPVPNKQHFPPEFRDKSRLAYYASIFNSIEVNSSFYKIPRPSTVAGWAEQVPDGFRFTFKLWKGITHVKTHAFDPEDVRQFIESIDRVGDKRGALLVQFPASVHANQMPMLVRLLDTLATADPGRGWSVALEFRHPSWYTDELLAVTEDFASTIVRHDKRGAASRMMDPDEPFSYLRFHGPDGDYKGQYAEEVLADHAEFIQQQLLEGKDIYAYFNNTAGKASQDLQLLNRLVGP